MSEEHVSELYQLEEFLDELPGSASRLRSQDAEWIMRLLADPEKYGKFTVAHTLRWAEKLGSTSMLTPSVFCAKLSMTLGLVFDLLDTESLMGLDDGELLKWVKTISSQHLQPVTGANDEVFRCTIQGVFLHKPPSPHTGGRQ